MKYMREEWLYKHAQVQNDKAPWFEGTATGKHSKAREKRAKAKRRKMKK